MQVLFVVTATTFALFKANTKETTKEVARRILALNRVNVVAVTTILVLHVGVIGHRVPRRSCFKFLQAPQGSRGG